MQDGEAGTVAAGGRRAGCYDIVLLDLGLPRRSGLEVLRTLRARGVRTPVLILTARDAVADRVAGLNAGADDYTVKPFDLQELAARMHALARRAEGRAEPLLRHGDIVLNPVTREVTLAGEAVHLSAREFALLAALLARPGRCGRCRSCRSACTAGTTRSAAIPWKSMSTPCARSSARR